MRHAALIGGLLAAGMLCGCMRPKPTYEYEPTVTFTGSGSEPLKRQDDTAPPPTIKSPATSVAPAESIAPAGVNLDGVAAGAVPAEPVPELAPAQAPAGGSAQRMIVTPDGALVSPDGKVLAPPGSVTPVQGVPAPPKKRATGWVHATD
jgi:hypothetical protein